MDVPAEGPAVVPAAMAVAKGTASAWLTLHVLLDRTRRLAARALGVRIEDVVTATADGRRRLTNANASGGSA